MLDDQLFLQLQLIPYTEYSLSHFRKLFLQLQLLPYTEYNVSELQKTVSSASASTIHEIQSFSFIENHFSFSSYLKQNTACLNYRKLTLQIQLVPHTEYILSHYKKLCFRLHTLPFRQHNYLNYEDQSWRKGINLRKSSCIVSVGFVQFYLRLEFIYHF